MDNEAGKAITKGIAEGLSSGFTRLAALGVTALLAYLKVVHHADIGWGWVFAPFWLPLAIVFGIFAAFGIVILALYCIGEVLDWNADRRRRKRRQALAIKEYNARQASNFPGGI